MISTDNQGNRVTTSDEDFTEKHYRRLLCIGKDSYNFATYDSIPWKTRFILWRHDLDFSVNRAAALAAIEAEVGITATYFVNPCSEFYNPFEPEQAKLLRHILGLGHRLGLHFDATSHNIRNEEQLHRKVAQEERWLQEAFGVRPDALSFHNPTANHLQFNADDYGGLVNCYSQQFKTKVPYCSDSNGYWRFHRLYDVLSEAKEPCLQVLTHPGWWQEKSMPPRQRVFRCAYGRAEATIRGYDEGLQLYGRVNYTGKVNALSALKESLPRCFQLCDYLWNRGEFQTLFVELWRAHYSQINRLCKAYFRKIWRIPARDVNAFFGGDGLNVDGWRLFNAVFDTSWAQAAAVDEIEYLRWKKIRNQLVHGQSLVAPAQLEQGCVALCKIIRRLAEWGATQAVVYDGLAHLGSIGLPTVKTADSSFEDVLECVEDDIEGFSVRRWEVLKQTLTGVGGKAEGCTCF